MNRQGFLRNSHHCILARAVSLRVILAVGALMGFDVWSLDVRQAFLQSVLDNDAMRPVYLEGPDELCLSEDELLRLMTPLYGLIDSGDLWNATLRHHHVEDLGMCDFPTDPSIFSQNIRSRLVDRLVGLSAN